METKVFKLPANSLSPSPSICPYLLKSNLSDFSIDLAALDEQLSARGEQAFLLVGVKRDSGDVTCRLGVDGEERAFSTTAIHEIPGHLLFVQY